MKPAGWIPGAGLVLALSACGVSVPDHSVPPPVHGQPAETAAQITGEAGSGAMRDKGLVVGDFRREGGPVSPGGTQPAELPLSGTVRFSAGRARAVDVRVGHSGTFAVRLPAGTYHVTGRTPLILEVLASGATRQTPCSQQLTVTVVPGRTVRLAVICIVP